MSNIAIADARARQATLHMVVTRADGTTQDLGMVAYYHRNFVWCRIVNLWITVRRAITG